MKKVLIVAMAAIWMLLSAVPVTAKAAEKTNAAVAGTILKTDADVEVYQEASETSEVTTMLETGTVVMVTDEDAGEGWCRISVRETTGYIKTGHLVPLVSSEEMDQEFEQIGNNYHMVFNEVQQVEKQRSQKKMWGAVIAILTAGIVAAGIIPVIRKNREDEKNRI